jgi:hypothetical protein
MSGKELLVILFGLFLGYWVVSRLFGSDGRPSTSSGKGQGDEPAPPAVAVPVIAAPWHEVLNVSPRATATEVHAAREALLAQYRPENAARLGAEISAQAERRIREIEAAVEQAMRELASR